MFLLALGVVFAVCFAVSRAKDPRLLRNGPFLVAAIAFGGAGLLMVLAEYSIVASILLWILGLAIPLSILVFGVGLIANGITMLRREGRSLGNQLSLIVGVLVLALPVISVMLVVQFRVTGFWLAALIGLASAYASVAFVSFALYSVVYGRMRHTFTPSAIVIHGSGLIRGRVPALLRGRLDRGLRVYGAELARGNHPVLVPSGGQGDDEPRPEGEAMADYLREQGVPEADILPETQSTSTRENIARSIELLDEADRRGPIMLVTSDYHVLRTASLARRMDVDAQVVGSRTARYYVPSAFIREFVALLVENRVATLIAVGTFAVLLVAILVGTLTSALG
ncbi:YdcF family protein [Paramicrobacterium chengjingii]|uniref:YdcF family protein n=1 Tax=Paramicrobacterium chengjingii TaxID=2769067 RepID=A0ABX6YHB5_9MICO|nr:YdcF family protein [Microbacterium chengjingii]QPZ38090.1 YdcF family protein [Microbacterium chengjingii]